MKIKTLFLDIDGVLNSRKFSREKSIEMSQKDLNSLKSAPVLYCLGGGLDMGRRKADDREKLRDLNDIDDKAVTLLNQILKETGAKVVVSSTWRLLRTLEAIRWVLESKGFVGEIIDHTEDLPIRAAKMSIILGRVRGQEIQEWLSRHPEVTSFAIVDDGSDMEPHMDKLVQTSYDEGLTQEKADELIEMLK